MIVEKGLKFRFNNYLAKLGSIFFVTSIILLLDNIIYLGGYYYMSFSIFNIPINSPFFILIYTILYTSWSALLIFPLTNIMGFNKLNRILGEGSLKKFKKYGILCCIWIITGFIPIVIIFLRIPDQFHYWLIELLMPGVGSYLGFEQESLSIILPNIMVTFACILIAPIFLFLALKNLEKFFKIYIRAFPEEFQKGILSGAKWVKWFGFLMLLQILIVPIGVGLIFGVLGFYKLGRSLEQLKLHEITIIGFIDAKIASEEEEIKKERARLNIKPEEE
ncbi:MAG: hypothetical protein ACTSRZ_03455 [Promethearchaeota archaeon]